MEQKSSSRAQKRLLLTIVVLFWFAQYVYVPYQTPYLTASGVSANLVGVIVGAYGLTQVLARLPVGIFADTVGRHRLFILAGALLAGAASLIRIFSPGGPGFLAANLCSGLASSMWISYMVHYTGFFEESRQQSATGIIVMANSAGMLLGFIASTVFYDWLGMRTLCLLSAVSGLLGAVLALFVRESRSREGAARRPAVRELLSVFQNRRLLLFALLAMVQQGIQMSTTMSFTTQILKDLGATTLFVGCSSVFYMVMAVLFSGFSSTAACARLGPRLLLPLVFSLVAVYCVLVPLVHSAPVIFLLQLLPGMSTGILFSYCNSEAVRGVPKFQKSTANGLFQAIYALGLTIFPMLTGRIADTFSVTAAYFVLAGFALLAAGCTLFSSRVGHSSTAKQG